jgi:hypothetical protein
MKTIGFTTAGLYWFGYKQSSLLRPSPCDQRKTAALCGAAVREKVHRERGEASVLGWPGSDLLSQVLRLSTIGAEEFNGRVRDGIGFRPLAKTTRPAKDG